MQSRSQATSPSQGEVAGGQQSRSPPPSQPQQLQQQQQRQQSRHTHSSSWTAPSSVSASSPRRHLSPPNKVPSSSGSPPTATSPRPNVHVMARERSFHREDSPSSRPPSIRSASSYGRPLNRFMHSGGHNAHTRRHSGYSNFSTMSETSLPWTTRDIGFNAISGVLNDPAKQRQTATKPSKADVPPVPKASITKVRSSDFETYLAHIQPVFERYRNNKLSNEDDLSASTPSPYGSLHTILDGTTSGRNPYAQNILSSESLALDTVDIAPAPPPRELPMIENVPSVFFDPAFHLEDPATFDAVCEGADIVGHTGPNPPLSTNSILQEKLSYYLDTVEVHLIREIENRSSSFFEALSNLQALHQETLDCVAQIHSIREKIKHIQSTECNDGMQVIQLQIKRRNLQKLHETIQLIKEIKETQPMIQVLLGQGDYFAALDLIDATRHLLQEGRDGLQLKGIKALSNFASQLDEMEKAVGIMMQHDFMSILLSDLTYRIETLDFATAQKYLQTGENPSKADDEDDLKQRLTSSALGLVRTDMLSSTLQGYRDRLLTDIKEIVRKRYPSGSPDDNTASSPNSVTRQLRTMPFDAFFKMLLDVFSALAEAIQRAALYHHAICAFVEEHMENDDPRQNAIKKDSADIVFAAADLAHVRCAKLIGFRGEQNAQLNPTDFYRLSSVIRTFIQRCESLCGRTCFGLRGTVLTQQKAFIDHFHMERVKQEAQLIENEQWVASEVPPDFQQIVDRICEGNMTSFDQEDQQQKEQKSTKFLLVHGTPYFVVGCGLLIIKMFEDYLRCMLNLEGMTTDIMQKLVELLKLFNSRVCQVILGAGAMRSAGLKNISAKHLALASQSLGIMVGLIPSLKECVGRHMPSKHGVLLGEFDRILKDYKDHQGEIHAKLIAIMNERMSVHVKAMQVIAWDSVEEEPSVAGKSGAHTYMETLVKETMTLHKVLSKYLPHADLEQIMSNVFLSFTKQLTQEIQRLQIHSQQGKERLTRDAEYFTRRLSTLNEIAPPSNDVIEAAQAIVISPS